MLHTCGRGKPLPYVTTKNIKTAERVIDSYTEVQKVIPG